MIQVPLLGNIPVLPASTGSSPPVPPLSNWSPQLTMAYSTDYQLVHRYLRSATSTYLWFHSFKSLFFHSFIYFLFITSISYPHFLSFLFPILTLLALSPPSPTLTFFFSSSSSYHRDVYRVLCHAAECLVSSPTDKERLPAMWRDLLRVSTVLYRCTCVKGCLCVCVWHVHLRVRTHKSFFPFQLQSLFHPHNSSH